MEQKSQESKTAGENDKCGSVVKNVSLLPSETVQLQAELETLQQAISQERQCIGHKERILGLDLTLDGQFLATASQDATVRVWHVPSNRLLTTLTDFRPDFECLRVSFASPAWGSHDGIDRDDNTKYLLATGGADGMVRLYGTADPLVQPHDWQMLTSIDHATLSHFDARAEDDKPQTYALQFIDHYPAFNNNDDDKTNSFLLTSSDDHVHLWELDVAKKVKTDQEGGARRPHYHWREVLSLRCGHLHEAGFGVHLCHVMTGAAASSPIAAGPGSTSSSSNTVQTTPRFGGDRNPDNLVYVFDASHCAANGLLGVALSDGSLRVINGRGVCLAIVQLPPALRAHLTSFGWDGTGTRLATSVATGHLVTWNLHFTADGSIQTSCEAVLQGGHTRGRPLFGAAYYSDDVILSWGADGKVCVWDAHARGEVDAPITVLVDKYDYPIYAFGLVHGVHESSNGDQLGVLALAGGSGEGGFIGIPTLLYTLQEPERKHSTKPNEVAGSAPTV